MTAGGYSYGLKATIQIVTRKMNDRKSYRVISIASSLEETDRLPLVTTPACIITRKYLPVNCCFILTGWQYELSCIHVILREKSVDNDSLWCYYDGAGNPAAMI